MIKNRYSIPAVGPNFSLPLTEVLRNKCSDDFHVLQGSNWRRNQEMF
jgi:hypothetical protein